MGINANHPVVAFTIFTDKDIPPRRDHQIVRVVKREFVG